MNNKDNSSEATNLPAMRIKVNRNNKLKRLVGKGEMNTAAIPKKISNVKISRVFNAKERGGCTICFPHGFETINATNKKNKRSWKHHRRKQYKIS